VTLVVLALVLVPLVALFAVARNQNRRGQLRSATVEVAADRDGVRRVLADGRTEAVRWDEVDRVEVFTTRVGPHEPSGGAVVLYGDAEHGCIVPIDRLGASHLLDHIAALPAFDVRTLVDAVGGTDHHAAEVDRLGHAGWWAPRPLQTTTVCWTRGAPQEPER
jgi:hypothetical protein